MLYEAKLGKIARTAGATCTICGIEIASDKTRQDFPSWTHDAVLLVDESLHLCDVPQYHWRETRLSNVPIELLYTERPIKRISAQNIAGDYFRLCYPQGAAVITGISGTCDVFLQHYIYFPAHRCCSNVVDDFIASKSTAPFPWRGENWTWSKIWDVLRLRAEAQSLTVRRIGPRDRYRALEPNNFFLPWHNQKGHESDPTKLNSGDPSLPGDWVRELASYARSLSRASEKEISFQRRLQELPLEVLDHILSFISPPEDLPQACTRLASAAVWRYAMLSRPGLPWLPRANDSKWPLADVDGDWEALARQLATKDYFASGEKLQTLPPSFTNRRRIWRILSSMYPGDVRPTELFPAEWQIPASWGASARLPDTIYVAKGHPDCFHAHNQQQISVDMGPTEQRKPCGNRACMCGKPSHRPLTELERKARTDTTGHGCDGLDAWLQQQRRRGSGKHKHTQFWTPAELRQLRDEGDVLTRNQSRQCR